MARDFLESFGRDKPAAYSDLLFLQNKESPSQLLSVQHLQDTHPVPCALPGTQGARVSKVLKALWTDRRDRLHREHSRIIS